MSFSPKQEHTPFSFLSVDGLSWSTAYTGNWKCHCLCQCRKHDHSIFYAVVSPYLTIIPAGKQNRGAHCWVCLTADCFGTKKRSGSWLGATGAHMDSVDHEKLNCVVKNKNKFQLNLDQISFSYLLWMIVLQAAPPCVHSAGACQRKTRPDSCQRFSWCKVSKHTEPAKALFLSNKHFLKAGRTFPESYIFLEKAKWQNALFICKHIKRCTVKPLCSAKPSSGEDITITISFVCCNSFHFAMWLWLF